MVLVLVSLFLRCVAVVITTLINYINPSAASAKYQPVSINHATNLNLNFKF